MAVSRFDVYVVRLDRHKGARFRKRVLVSLYRRMS